MASEARMLLAALTLTFSLLASSAGATTLHLTEGEAHVIEGYRVLSLDEVRPAEAETAQTRARRERDLRRVARRLDRAPEGPERLALQLDQADLLLQQAMDPAALVEAPVLLEQAVEIYKQVLKLAPAGPRADEARFHLGRALNALGQEEQANAELTRLVKSAPESPHVPESYLLLGEYYFKHHVYAKAMMAYKKASAYTESPYQSFALYKMAWCLNRLGEHAEAVSTMEAVVKREPPPPLRAAAAEVLPRFYADNGDLGPVYTLLEHRPEEGARIVEDLVRRDLEQGRFDEAISMLRRLIADAPSSPRAPRYQGQIVAARQGAGRRIETLEEIDRYLKTYGPASSWARTNAANPDAVAAAQEELERLLRAGTIQYHMEFKKTGSREGEISTIACQFYKAYLDTFPESPHAADLRYGYGELLYRLKRYDEAYIQYMAVAAAGPGAANAQVSAEYAILAAEEMVKVEATYLHRPRQLGSIAPLETTPWEQRFLGACEQYARLWPEDGKTRHVLYKQGYVYQTLNQFDAAERLFREVIARDVLSLDAELAASLILDADRLRSDWARLRDDAAAFYAQPGLGGTGFKEDALQAQRDAEARLAAP